MKTLIQAPVKAAKKTASGLRKSGQFMFKAVKELTKEEPPDPNRKPLDFSSVKTEWSDIGIMAACLILPIGVLLYKLWKGTLNI